MGIEFLGREFVLGVANKFLGITSISGLRQGLDIEAAPIQRVIRGGGMTGDSRRRRSSLQGGESL